MTDADDMDESFSEPDDAYGLDALSLLRQDHQDVKELFDAYDTVHESMDDEARRAMAERICALLRAHAQIEEEIFYPAARGSLDEQDLLDEAEVEHASARELIEQIESMDPDEALYDAKVKVLGEYVAHHVHEEEDELFPLIETSDLDLDDLGRQMQARKDELLEELGLEQTA